MVESSRVLVTRPSGQQAGLCALLEEAGYVPVCQPMLQVEPLEQLDAAGRQMLQDLDRYGHVIFVSANAVHYGLECIDDLWPQRPVGLSWYAVGPSSDQLLAASGIAALCPTHRFDSEGLLELPSLQHLDEQRVLLVRGQGGRDLIRSTLVTRGARVDVLECYRRAMPTINSENFKQVLETGLSAILISSGEGLGNMLSLLPASSIDAVYSTQLVVPGPRVAKLATEAGFSHVVCAASATDKDMLAALCQTGQGGTRFGGSGER